MSNRNTPKAPKKKSGAARLPGYERCWCRGFNVGCGLIRSRRTRQRHTVREREIRKGRISIITRHIRRRSLTLQFLEKQADLLVDILMELIDEVNDGDHLNAPRELQDGVSVDNVDLEAGNDQSHDATTGSQDDDTSAFDFQNDQSLSSPPEPGPSRASRACQVFDVGLTVNLMGRKKGKRSQTRVGNPISG